VRLLVCLALLGLSACAEKVRLALELPTTGSLTYEVAWRAGAHFTFADGSERDAEAQVRGQLIVEPAGASRWWVRIADAIQTVSAPSETGLKPDPGGLKGLVFLLGRTPGAKPTSSALARPPETVLPLLTPKSPLLMASFPPLPREAVRRGERWAEEAILSWPHPDGTLDGTLRLRMRLVEVRRAEDRKVALVRVHGDVEMRSLSPKAPACRGALQAEVLLDVESGTLRRAVVEDQWLVASRDARGRELRFKSRGEWTLRLASPPESEPK
jgi:hypothetical protein